MPCGIFSGSRPGAVPVATGICVFVVLLAMFAASATAATLRRSTSGDPNSLDAHIAVGNSAAPILYDLNTGLTTIDGDGRLVPGLAESWTVSDDGLRYTFRLRDGLKWSDGAPLTSADFVYSARRLVTPATAARFASFFYPVRNARAILRGEKKPEEVGVAAPDARTVVYDLEFPAPYFLQTLSANVTAPVPRHKIEELGRQWTRAGQMVSSGPYRLIEAVPQSHFVLVRNPHFYDADSVRIDEVHYYPTQNLETSLRRYLAGEFDIVLNFPMESIRDLEKNRPGEMRVGPALAISFLIPNQTKPPFDDARVREALSLVIDREGLVERFLTPGTEPAYGPTPPAISNYESAVPDYTRLPMAERIAKAKQLMAAAGYGPSKPLEFELRYDSLEESRRIAVALGAMWKPLGVSMNPLNTDINTLNRHARTGEFQMLRYAWFSPNDDAYTFLGLVETGNPNNLGGYSNPRYDQMLREANALGDTPERSALLREAEALMMKDHPLIPLFFYVRRVLVQPHVQGFVLNERGLNPTRYLDIRRSP